MLQCYNFTMLQEKAMHIYLHTDRKDICFRGKKSMIYPNHPGFSLC